MYTQISYTDLENEFRNQVQTALYHYQRAFENKRMPSHRVADLAALYASLTVHDDVLTLRDEINRVLAAFKTGWFIFKTGRSRLREAVQPCLLNPRYSVEAFLRARNAELEQQFGRLSINSEEDNRLAPRDDGIDTLRDDLKIALAIIRKLKTNIALLKAQNDAFKEQIKSLEEKNHRLAGRNKNKRTMSHFSERSTPVGIPGAMMNEDETYASSGTSMRNLFGSFPSLN